MTQWRSGELNIAVRSTMPTPAKLAPGIDSRFYLGCTSHRRVPVSYASFVIYVHPASCVAKSLTMHPVRVGILGGGQLGRMLAIAARPLGMRVIIVDPSPSCPAACVADEHIVAPFTDASAIAELASKSDVITVEIEHVNAEALAAVEDRVTVQPPPKTVAMIQDKFAQKEFFRAAGVPLGEFKSVASAADVISAAAEASRPHVHGAPQLRVPPLNFCRTAHHNDRASAIPSCSRRGGSPTTARATQW